MTAREAYDDCIKAAREAARRQRESAKSKSEEIQRVLHECGANTLDAFADMLEKMKEIRCR